MGSYVRERWVSEHVSGVPRADRRSCEYEAYMPDPLIARPVLLDGEVAADVADAETAIARLDARTSALTDTETLARLLLRAECVASSRIEGLEVGPRRLLKAEAALQMGESAGDMTSEEVLGNIEAMRTALLAAEGERPVATETVLDIHRHLLQDTRSREHAGRIRSVQNWVGGSGYNPCSAAFVPPPPENVSALLNDLAEFCNSDSLPAVVQAAIVHAQFETIHPFADGNGRTGRALMHMILRRRGATSCVQPPISLILATRARGYIAGLTSFRFDGSIDCPDAHEGLNAWVGFFAAACSRAVEDAVAFEDRCKEFENEWRSRLERVREGSSMDRLLSILPGMPILSVKSAMSVLERSKPQVNDAIARLVDAGILKQTTVGKRNRAFEAPEVLDAFTALERQLASPDADIRTSPPSRPVPSRTDS